MSVCKFEKAPVTTGEKINSKFGLQVKNVTLVIYLLVVKVGDVQNHFSFQTNASTSTPS